MLNKYLRILRLYGCFKNHKYFYYLYPYYSAVKRLRKYRPMFAEIFFESSCNFRCWHCSSAEMLNKGISFTIDQIDIILRKLKSVGVLSVCYVGGEPTIRKDLPDIIRLTDRYRILPSIITNGSLLDKSGIDNLFKNGLANISFSLQSSIARVHDKLVNRENAFSKLFEGLEYCLKKNYPCSLCVVPTNENLLNGDFEGIIKYATEKNIRVNVNLPAAIGKLLDDTDALLTEESLALLFNKYFMMDNVLPDFKQSNIKANVFCPMGINALYILPNGETCPCTFTQISFGNILEEPIETILRRMNESSLLQDVERRNNCPIAMDKGFIKKVSTYTKQSSSYPYKWKDDETHGCPR